MEVEIRKVANGWMARPCGYSSNGMSRPPEEYHVFNVFGDMVRWLGEQSGLEVIGAVQVTPRKDELGQ